MSGRTAVAVAACLVGVTAAACSGNSAPVVRSGPTTALSATSAAPTTTVSATTAPRPSTQTVTVTPSTNLVTGQTVTVTGTGFSPNESLVVTECAAKGTATGPGDCDLSNLQSTTSDAQGKVKMKFTVNKGPFGTNRIVCGPTQQCLVSVSQATPSPTEEADAQISF